MSLVLSNVVREIRSFDSVGGNQIRLSEARNLLGQAKADQVIDASERDVLKAVLRAGELTSKAEALCVQPCVQATVMSSPTTAHRSGPRVSPSTQLASSALTGSKAKTPGKPWLNRSQPHIAKAIRATSARCQCRPRKRYSAQR